MPRVDRVMHLSNAHMTKQDSWHISSCHEHMPNVFVRETGYMIWAGGPELRDIYGYTELSDHFYHCLQVAKANGCEWVMFDRDEPIWEDGPLEVFDW